MQVKSFCDLEVWKTAHELTLAVYAMTEKFPRREHFGITAQLRRCAASVPANIAEGFGRGTTRELLRCLQIARGELEETRYFLMLSKNLGHVTAGEFAGAQEKCDSIGRQINGLTKSLRQRLVQAGAAPAPKAKTSVISH